MTLQEKLTGLAVAEWNVKLDASNCIKLVVFVNAIRRSNTLAVSDLLLDLQHDLPDSPCAVLRSVGFLSKEEKSCDDVFCSAFCNRITPSSFPCADDARNGQKCPLRTRTTVVQSQTNL
ncbi:hypothetical protein OUZ56_027755 [Daphnia magna]|uniref:Uncharacterized protein n=1 Tax=Daphnia magna TaxID=35525 RepID=A0ABR0B221_9CRUS|nr:hypothetical protein OUZ56_027755 [Daphnia magna]